MKATLAFVTAAFASLSATVLAIPTLYLVGDSTMASHTAAEGIQGWGVEIPNYLQNINIVNRAVSGRSARSYTMEGRWAQILALLKSGDYVVIEFGHNDGGDPATYDTASVVGEGTQTQTVTRTNGTVEVVYTFNTYLGRMVHDALAIGATPIISSQTPNNPYENSATIVVSPPRFVQYAKDVAGNYSVPYVDHWGATIAYYTKLGKATVDAYYPNDHTHTNTAGAISVAWAFVSGLKCSAAKGVLASYINSAGQSATCNGGGPSSSTSSTKSTSSTSKSSSTSSASGGTQTQYGQCGGIGWTGPTTCVSGTTCKYSNDWYSQCL